jgi:hypothetical protein
MSSPGWIAFGCSGAATPADPHAITVRLQSREPEPQRRIRRRSGRAASAVIDPRAFDVLPPIFSPVLERVTIRRTFEAQD